MCGKYVRKIRNRFARSTVTAPSCSPDSSHSTAVRSSSTGRPKRMQEMQKGEPETVSPGEAQGSHMLTGLARSDALIEVAADRSGVAGGDELEVHASRRFD